MRVGECVGEAMACGVVCAASNVGDTAEIIGDYGFLFAKSDLEGAINASIKALSLSKNERLLLSAKARSHIACEYDIEDVASRYRKAYQRMIDYGV